MIKDHIHLMGHQVDIVFDPQLIFKQDALGFADYRNNIIYLQPSTEQYPIPESVIEQTYLHEVLHFIFNQLGEFELRSNESLVHNMAGLLHQALKGGDLNETSQNSN